MAELTRQQQDAMYAAGCDYAQATHHVARAIYYSAGELHVAQARSIRALNRFAAVVFGTRAPEEVLEEIRRDEAAVSIESIAPELSLPGFLSDSDFTEVLHV